MTLLPDSPHPSPLPKGEGTTLCLTPGDPNGIGPEITVRFLQQVTAYPQCRFLIIGSRVAVENAAKQLSLTLPQTTQIEWIDIPAEKPGQVAYEAIVEAIKQIHAGQAQALITGPINKKNLINAGYDASGHTEILEWLAKELYGASPQADMLFAYQKFRLLLLTRHIPLSQVSQALAGNQTQQAFLNLIHFLQNTVKIESPRIAVLGVNPHAGEIGGNEERDILIPLMRQLEQTSSVSLEGPFPADGFFRGFDVNTLTYDAVVAPYHDQGLIPFKLIAGHEAVNITIGLPFIRTSVSHGTAEDIAGQGIASPKSLIAAVETAMDLVNRCA